MSSLSFVIWSQVDPGDRRARRSTLEFQSVTDLDPREM